MTSQITPIQPKPRAEPEVLQAIRRKGRRLQSRYLLAQQLGYLDKCLLVRYETELVLLERSIRRLA